LQEEKRTMRKTALETAGSRLRSLRTSLQLTQAALATTVGVSQDTISRIERTGAIEPVVLIAICCVHKVSRAWLERGEGPMFAGELQEGEFSPVPLVNLRLAAGSGAEIYEEGELKQLQFRTAWLRGDLRASVANLVAMRVEGESMEPTLSAGDVVLVDRSRTDPTRDGLYALRQDNALLVKRTRAEGGRVLLVSDNPEFPATVFPWPAPIHRAQVIGRVVWAGKRF
jgi:phage repressor protein C with HTH and peptisase S24 domain